MKYLSSTLVYLTRTSPEADYFRENSLLATSMLAGAAAWLWVGQLVGAQLLTPVSGLLLFGLIGLVAWLVYRWYRERYLYATLAFLLGQAALFAGMIYQLGDLTPGYLFLFSVMTAGALLGPVGAFGMALLATLLELFVMLTGLQHPELFPTLTLLQFLAAVISTQAAHGLYTALRSAEEQAQESRAHAAEARQHRGELHRTLKSLDSAYLQLERINAELLQARATADAALSFKKEFIAQTSHELRTPLNLIIGFSETMAFSQHSYGVKLPAPYLRDVTEIHRNSRHLLSLIDDILDLSKLESGRMGLRFNLVGIGEIFQGVYDTIQPLTQAKGLELTLSLPPNLPRMWLDQARIHQVLLNLVSNAARLTRQGSISLKAEFREIQNDLLLQVHDTGPGIPPEQLAQIFEEFQQASETAGMPGTTGLGLTISKRIVELHGGHLWAESAPGKGSTFSFSLPVYKPLGESMPSAQSEQPKNIQPSVILLADETSEDFGLIQRHLDGFLLTSAPSWQVASQMIGKIHARAIVSAHAPPAESSSLPIPVVICPLPSSQETAQAWNIHACLRKPLTIRALRAALRAQAPAAKKLLLVDEDPSSLRLLERMALGLDKTYQILRAYTVVEALERLKAQPLDAILLDLDIAKSRELIHEAQRLGHVAILGLSGLDGDENLASRPIQVHHGAGGLTATALLRYLQAILAAIPPAKL